MIDLD